MLLLPPPHQHSNCFSRKKPEVPCALGLWVQVPGKAEVLPPSAGSRRDQPRLRRAEPVFQRCTNTSPLSLCSREKELAALKQQVSTLRATVAKEEEKVADLKHKVQLFSSGEHEADDQVHAGIQARGVHMCTSGSSPPATSIPGTEQTGVALGRDQHCFPAMALQQGWFGALLRQQTGANVSAPCSCCEVMSQRQLGSCRLSQVTAKLGRGDQQEDGSIQPSVPAIAVSQPGNRQLSLVEGIEVFPLWISFGFGGILWFYLAEPSCATHHISCHL